MNPRLNLRLSLLFGLLLCSCASAPRQQGYDMPQPDAFETDALPRAEIQGFIGILELNDNEYDLAPGFADSVDVDLDTLPTMGFVVQQAVFGKRLKVGFEAGASVGWENDTAAFSTGGGGLIIVGENDVLLVDGFAGLHASLAISPRARFYGGMGPLLQYANVELEYDNMGTFMRESESDFGTGLYGRLGFEYEFTPGTRVGLFVRYLDSSVDFGSAIEEVELAGTQLVLAVTRAL